MGKYKLKIAFLIGTSILFGHCHNYKVNNDNLSLDDHKFLTVIDFKKRCLQYSVFLSLDNCSRVQFLDSLYNAKGTPRSHLDDVCFNRMIGIMSIITKEDNNLDYGPFGVSYISDSMFYADKSRWLEKFNCP
jgi:hypothetical protein